MNEQFQKYSLRIFDELNNEVNSKVSSIESKKIDDTVKNLMKLEEIFTDIENKLDKSLNKIIIAKLNKDIENELNFIN
jgi:flagellin-specific chaperone FliS